MAHCDDQPKSHGLPEVRRTIETAAMGGMPSLPQASASMHEAERAKEMYLDFRERRLKAEIMAEVLRLIESMYEDPYRSGPGRSGHAQY